MRLKGSVVGTVEDLEKTELARCSGLARVRESAWVPSTSAMVSREERVDETCGAGMPWREWRRGILLVNPCEKVEGGNTYGSSFSSGKGGGGFLKEEERESVAGSSFFSSGKGPPKRLS
jgi:hypothetical protein